MSATEHVAENVGQSEKMNVFFDVRSCLYLDRGCCNMNVCPRHTEQENSLFKFTLEVSEDVISS